MNEWCFRPRFSTEGYTGPETTWANEMNSVMPLVQDRSLDLLARSLARYHCTMDVSDWRAKQREKRAI